MIRTVLFLCFLLSVVETEACAIIIGYKNGQVLVGNNEDWYHSDGKYWVEMPDEPGEHFSAYFFGFEGDGKFAQGGMNQAGLMFDGTAVSRIEIDRDHVRKNKLRAAPVHLFKDILKRCRTIEEAEAMIKGYFIPYIRSAQIVMVDANAGYLIVKANGATEKGHLEDGEFKIITNFHLEDLDSGNYTCYRYDLARSMLENHFENTVPEFESLLYSVHQEYPGATVYSNIFNLTNASSTLYYNAVFESKVTLDFKGDLPETPVELEQGVFRKRMIEALSKAYKKGGIADAVDFFMAKKNLGGRSEYQADAQQLIDLSEYLYRQAAFDDYEYVLKEAAHLFPEDPGVHLALGKSCLRKGDTDCALPALESVLEIDPENYWANRLIREYSGKGECHLEFRLKGFENARSVILYGNFNEWRGIDNVCRKVDGVWITCIDSRERDLEYRYKVDGQWVEDPGNPCSEKLPNGLEVSVITRR